MEKETITIPIEEYKELLDIKSDRDYEEEEQVREQEEKDYEAARNTLAKKMFDLCVEYSDPTEVVNSIIDQEPELICEVFSSYSPFEIHGAVMDFVEDQDYHDPITDETYTLSSWCDFFHDPEDYGTVEYLHERCKKLFQQKQELLNQLKGIIKESLD